MRPGDRPITAAKLCSSFSIALACALASGLVQANQELADFKKDWYQIEVILFKQTASSLSNTEVWSTQPGLDYPADLQILKHGQPATVLQPAEVAPSQPEEEASTLLFDSLDLEEASANDSAQNDFSQFEVPGAEQAPDATIEDSDLYSDIRELELLPIDLESLPSRIKEPTDLRKAAYTHLPESMMHLSALKQRIERALDLQLITHVAWRQPLAPDQKQFTPVLIQAGLQQDLAFEFESLIRLVKNRYLHIESQVYYSKFKEELLRTPLNLGLFAAQDPKGLAIETEGKAEPYGTTSVFEASIQPAVAREMAAAIETSRRINLEEVHFLDHPLFGMIFRVSQFAYPDPVLEMQPFDLELLPKHRTERSPLRGSESLPTTWPEYPPSQRQYAPEDY